jgi:toxin ParE1/3/4
MTPVWSPQAIDDLAALRARVLQENPAAAQRMVARFVDLVDSLLAAHPEMGRPGRVPGTRELVIAKSPYIVPYRLRHDVVEVLRVYHSARRWPAKF